jgi:glucose-6-phosphate isomerase
LVIIIPPGFGHCSVNSGEGPLLFSNIAVVSCPLYYQPIKDKHGLSVYLLRTDKGISYVKNPSYKALPAVKRVEPKADSALGITFGKPVYGEFIKAPDKFDFLLHPEKYLDAMDAMTREGEALSL